MKSSEANEPVVVLGMYRSGTSCVARCVHELGVFMGESADLFPADQFNQGGYFEICELISLNRKVLAFFGMQHFRIEEIPPHWAELPGADLLIEDIADTLSRLFDQKGRWGLKEPQASLLLPVYEQVFARLNLDPLYVICVRNPLDVFGSQNTHSHLPAIGEAGIGLWIQYTLTALRHSRGRRRMVIPYEEFLSSPSDYLEGLISLAPEWQPDSERLSRACATVKPEWRQNHVDEAGLSGWPPIVRDVLGLGRRCAHDPTGFAAGKYDDDVESLWDAWKRTREMVRTPVIPEGMAVISEDREGGLTSEVVVKPLGRWQSLSLAIPQSEDSRLLVEIYQLPAVIWIRNATLVGGGRRVPARLEATIHGNLTEDFGCFKLVQWGWYPLQLLVPIGFRPESLELDVWITWNVYAVEDAVTGLRNRASKLWQA